MEGWGCRWLLQGLVLLLVAAAAVLQGRLLEPLQAVVVMQV